MGPFGICLRRCGFFFCASLFTHLTAVIAQIILPLLMYMFPIERAEDVFEHILTEHSQVLKEHLAHIPPTPLNMKDHLESEVHRICHHDHTVRFAQTALIVLWLLRLCPGVMQAFWLTRVSILLPIAQGEEPLLVKEGDEVRIVRLTRFLQVCFAFGVNLPRVLVQLLVSYVGAKFLLYSSTLSILIIKCLSLFFLATIDTVVFEGLASHKYQTVVAGACYHYHCRRLPTHWNLWGASVVKAIVVLGSALWFARVHHASLQEWRDLCLAYENAFPPPCVKTYCGLHVFGTYLKN